MNTAQSPSPELMPSRLLFGVVGFPVGHSLSPVLHSWAFTRSGFPGVYFAWEKKPEELPDFLSTIVTLPIAGASVTLPHKETVMQYLESVTPRAAAVGAVNTLYWENGRLAGDNTDVEGFIHPLRGKTFDAALVLGGGGSARAVLAGLKELGVSSLTVAARSPQKAAALSSDFGATVIPWEEKEKVLAGMPGGIVVNCTPLGMDGPYKGQSPLPPEAFAAMRGKDFTVCDCVYVPLLTPLLRHAQAAGLHIQDGLDFFVAQGLAQFRLWSGKSLPHDAAKSVILHALNRRGSHAG